MTNNKDIRMLIEQWDKTTYLEGIDQCIIVQNEYTKDEISKVQDVLEDLSLSGKCMKAESIEQLLPRKHKNTEFNRISFSTLFSEMNYISPAVFVAEVIKQYYSNPNMDYDPSLYAAKGLSDFFPSFLRELDLEQKILEALPGAQSFKSPQMDEKNHADIVLNYKGAQYSLWSYRCSDPALRHLHDKICGKNGKTGIMNPGINVLCPLTETYENVKGWHLYEENVIKEISECICSGKTTDLNKVKGMPHNDSFFSEPGKFLVPKS